MMHAISVVPEDAEVFSSAFHARKTIDDFVGIRGARRIGIFGHAPDAFDGGVVRDSLFDEIHVGTVFVHGNRDKLETEALGYQEMPVIAGNGAKPLHVIQLAPGRRAKGAVRNIAGNSVVHKRRRRR